MNHSSRARLLAVVAVLGWAVRSDLTRPAEAAASGFFQSPEQPKASPTPTPRVNHGSIPIVSPDGSRILFISTRGGADDLFVISAEGTGEVRLTETPESETGPQWTGDGRRVMFSIFADETSHLHSIDPQGSDEREIGRFPGRAPTLSPDGKRVIYMAGTWTATRLMVSNLDGSDARQINDGATIAWNNHWSPDGKRIAFTGRDGPKGEVAVFVMNADGSETRHLTHIAPDEGGAQWPVWSPDGREIAFQVNSRIRPGMAYIWIADAATGDARKLSAHDRPYLDETPSWFPEGKSIAFQSNRTGPMEVWVMNTDGSGARQVTGASLPPAGSEGPRQRAW